MQPGLNPIVYGSKYRLLFILCNFGYIGGSMMLFKQQQQNKPTKTPTRSASIFME